MGVINHNKKKILVKVLIFFSNLISVLKRGRGVVKLGLFHDHNN